MRWCRNALLVAVLLVVPAGCGADPSPAAGESPRQSGALPVDGVDFNPVDVMFLQMMVAHHTQGLEIVRLAAEHTVGPEVRTLAAAIDVTEADEIASMQRWLGAWGRPPTTDPSGHVHAAHGGLPLTAEAQLSALRAADESTFERTFLNLLIAHQHNAVEMARNETDQGINRDARDLADRIVRSRSAQIAQMLGYVSR